MSNFACFEYFGEFTSNLSPWPVFMPESPAHKGLKVECNAIHQRPVNNDVWQKANVENTTSAPSLKT